MPKSQKKTRKLVRLEEYEATEETSVARVDPLVEIRRLLRADVQVGNCRACPLRAGCPEANDTDKHCRLVKKRVDELVQKIREARWIVPENYLGLKPLLALFSSTVVAEEYFRQNGVFSTNRSGEPGYSAVYKDYMKLVDKLHSMLDAYGMTPKGLIQIRSKQVDAMQGVTKLQMYIEEMKKHEVKK